MQGHLAGGEMGDDALGWRPVEDFTARDAFDQVTQDAQHATMGDDDRVMGQPLREIEQARS